MFALTDGMHYYLCQHYVDMRKGMTGLYRLVKSDRKSTRLNSSHRSLSRMPSSA